MSIVGYGLLLVAVGLIRLIELRVSRRNQKELESRGARLVPDPSFPWMVALHTGVLGAAGLEVLLLERVFLPALGWPMLAVLVLTNLGRWWVIRTLGGGWTVRVMTLTGRPVAARGPFRWVRHPNYLCVFFEMIVLPLVHTAWITALVGTLAHVLVLRARIAVEDNVLLADKTYRDEMRAKPSFLPRQMGS